MLGLRTAEATDIVLPSSGLTSGFEPVADDAADKEVEMIDSDDEDSADEEAEEMEDDDTEAAEVSLNSSCFF